MNKNLPRLVLAALFFILPFSADASTPTMCTMQYQPVCGAQQVQCVTAPCYPQYHTYGNSCTMNAEKGTFIHEGECTASETGPVKQTKPYTPPSNCTAWFDGCNSCSRGANGQSACTLRACMDEPQPGYCTAYEKPPVLNPAPIISSTTTVEASTSATTSNEGSAAQEEVRKSGFVHDIWAIIMSWFSWL